MKNIKRIVIFFASLTVLTFTSCAKSNKKSGNDANKTKTVEKVEKIEEKTESEKMNPEIEKLGKVLASMSERCKQEMSDGSATELLADLKKVLDEEQNFPSDDISLYYLIDKKHNIGSEYEPTHLRKLVKNDDYIINKTTLSLREDVEDALRVMARAAKQDGITFDVSSTYRSYETQERTFNYWVSVDGLYEAERESARPGTSQHQLGVAIDFGNIDDSFAQTAECKWLTQNCEKYGWSLSFPQGYEDITGYRWECWHFRYIGVEACKFQKKWFNDIQQFMFEFIDAWKNA